jgi:hypothetical protein
MAARRPYAGARAAHRHDLVFRMRRPRGSVSRHSCLHCSDWAGSRGRNVQIEYRWGKGDAETLRREAMELAALAPDSRLWQTTDHHFLTLVSANYRKAIANPLISAFPCVLPKSGQPKNAPDTFRISVQTDFLKNIPIQKAELARDAALFFQDSSSYAWVYPPPRGLVAIQQPERSSRILARQRRLHK